MSGRDHKSRAAELAGEFMAGYREGGDRDAPEPSGNRSPAYRHSFEVRRAELAGDPIPAPIARARSAEIAEEALGQPGARRFHGRDTGARRLELEEGDRLEKNLALKGELEARFPRRTDPEEGEA